ncbi:MAG TPA: hypothetical protein PKM25_16080 [Candidatus Ozemobacteraceae bacterium]|nr:hypothetical protein [Candidatus Ozemobacteraceae bacterium]
MKDHLNALETALDTWTEGERVTSFMSYSWSAALEAAKSSDMECLSKFLSTFEMFFSMLARDGAPLPAMALWLGKGAVFEAKKILAATNGRSASAVDPVEVIKSLKDAFDLKTELERLSEDYNASKEKQPISSPPVLISVSNNMLQNLQDNETSKSFLLEGVA